MGSIESSLGCLFKAGDFSEVIYKCLILSTGYFSGFELESRNEQQAGRSNGTLQLQVPTLLT